MPPAQIVNSIVNNPITLYTMLFIGPCFIVYYLKTLADKAKREYTHPDAPLFAVVEGIVTIAVIAIVTILKVTKNL